MKPTLLLSATVIGLLAFAIPSQAQIAVSVQFAPYYGGAGNMLNGNYSAYPTGYYAGGDPVQYWNVANNSVGTGAGTPVGPLDNTSLITPTVLVPGTGTTAPVYTPATTLYDSTGNASTLLFQLSGANDNRYSVVGFDNGSTNNGSTGPFSQFNPTGNLTYFLMSGVEAIDGTGTENLALAGLNPTDYYNVYAYVQSLNFDTSERDTVQLGSQYFSLMTDNGVVTTGTQSTYSGTGTAPMADYVEFTGVLGSDLMTNGLSETGNDTGFAGFQVVDVGAVPPAVPEPSTVWMFSLGFLGLMAHVYRKRNARS